MTATTGTQFSKPSTFEEFEIICAAFWKAVLKDPNVQRFSRRGKGQSGIDMLGKRDRDPRQLVGVQCKLKSGTAKLTKKEVADELKQALEFRPALTEYHMMTTADVEGDLQQLALELAVEQADNGRTIDIVIWGWGSICDEGGQYEDVIKALDRGFSPFLEGMTLTIVEGHQDLKATMGTAFISVNEQLTDLKKIIIAAAPTDTTQAVALAVEAHLDAEIDSYRDLIANGKLLMARDRFGALLERVRDTASPRVIFRIKANIGTSFHWTNDDVTAARWLFEAYEHAPDEPKAIANKGLAHLLSGDFEAVLEMGVANLANPKADELLSSHVIQAARFTKFQGDPLDLVHERDRDTQGVVVALVLYHRGRGDIRWRDTVILLCDRFPDDPLCKQLAAEAVLDRVTMDPRYVQFGKIDEPTRRSLDDAILVLSGLWETRKTSEGGYGDGDVALASNLMLAFRTVGDFKSGVALLREVLPIAGDDQDFLIRAAATAVEAGDTIADELITKLDEGVAKQQLSLHIAITRGEWQRLGSLDPAMVERFPEVERQTSLTAIRLGQLEGKQDEEVRTKLEALLAELDGGDIRSELLVAHYSKIRGIEETAQRAWEQAYSRIGSDTHYSARMMAALYASKNQLASEVADLLWDAIPRNQDSQELKALANAVVSERPMRKRAAEFFSSLPDELRKEEPYQYFEGLAHFNSGALDLAEPFIRARMVKRADISVVLLLLSLLKRQRRESEIPSILFELDISSLPGSPGEKLALAHELAACGEVQQALEFGYRVQTDNPSDPDAALRYVSLFFSIEEKAGFVAASEVGEGVWVKLESDGGRSLEFTVDRERDDAGAGFFAPSHEMAVRAMGLKLGAEFTITQPIGGPVTWRVAEVKHRFVHALHVVLGTFQTNFPKEKGIFSWTMKEDDITPIVEFMKGHAERRQRFLEIYVRHGVPLGMMAGLIGLTTIEFAGGLAEAGEWVRVCHGNRFERAEALRAIRQAGSGGVVLDALAALKVANLDLFDVIQDAFGEILLPQACMDELVVFSKQEAPVAGRSMTTWWQDGKLYRREFTREEVLEHDAYIRQQLDKIAAACRIVPAVAPNTASSLADSIAEEFDEAALAAAYVAAEGRLLLSEDMHIRTIAKNAWNVKGVWLQAVLMHAREAGTLPETRYASAISQLASARHEHLSLDAKVLMQLLEDNCGGDLKAFTLTAQNIGNSNADIFNHVSVVADFINQTRGTRKASASIRLKAIGVLMEKLVRYGNVPWPFIIGRLEDQVLPLDGTYGEAALLERDMSYVGEWLKGHFLSPNLVTVAQRTVQRWAIQRLRSKSPHGNVIAVDAKSRTRTTPTLAGIKKTRRPKPPTSGAPSIPRKRRRSRKQR
jgi:hypothetical protein